MGLIKFFGKQALNSFKRAVGDMHSALNEIDVDSFESRFQSMREDFTKEVEKFANKFKNFGGKYVVEVPYDRDKQTLSYKIENGTITITVETNEETENGSFKSKSVTTTNVPEDVCVDNITQRYLKDEKKMLFILKKNKVEVVNEDDDFEPISDEVKETEKEVCHETISKTEKDELVKKMVHMHLNGCSYRKISEECGVSDKTAKRWIGKWLTEHDSEGLL